MKPSARLPYQPHLDGLRGLAVIAVLAFHAFPTAVPGGFTGVDVFFVISGFLISSLLQADFAAHPAAGRAVIAHFYGRRIRRIFPALIVLLAACYGLGFFLLIPNEFEKLCRDLVASAGFSLNLVLAGQVDYFNNDALSRPLLHLWSLGVEEQFYLLWPLVLWGVARLRGRILPIALFLAALSFCWNQEKYPGTAAAAFYLPQMRLWELGVGSILAALLPLGTSHPTHRAAEPWTARVRSGLAAPWAGTVLGLVGLALIAIGCFRVGDSPPPNAGTLFPVLGAACIVGAGSAGWVNRHLLSHRWLVGVGLISYPLYLWHWPLLAFARIGGANPASIPERLTLLAVAVVLAWLTYRLVERPIRQEKPRAARAPFLVGLLAVVALIGLYTERQRAFPQRFPALINDISNFKYDPAQAVRQGRYFLIGDQNASNFAKDPHEILPGKPTLYLWGDSHAAALYPGISAVYGRTFNVVQRTTAKTPPFMPQYFNPGNAREISDFVIESIKRDRPEYVVLEADWPEYGWAPVEDTIAALKAAGVPHIVLVGPVPQWFGTLPQQMFNYVRHHRSAPVPTRMKLGENPEPVRVDPLMRALARRLQVEYVSPCQILRTEDGPLVRTGDSAETLMTYDSSHLTASGSRYLVARFPKF